MCQKQGMQNISITGIKKIKHIGPILVNISDCYRRGEHFGVQQVSTDILDGWDFQEARSSKDVSHTAVADRECSGVSKVQQSSQSLGRHKVDVVDVLLVDDGP